MMCLPHSDINSTLSKELFKESLLLVRELLWHFYDVRDHKVTDLAVLLEDRHSFTLEPLHEPGLGNFIPSIDKHFVTI